MSALLTVLAPLVRPHGKEAFFKSLAAGTHLLDVGCGNNSPARAKTCAPTIHYTGIDVGDYNQRTESIAAADEYLISTPEGFSAALEALAGRFDAVVSSHNLEHCNEPARVLSAICTALKPGGRIYLSFPSEASIHLPKRSRNTLNFFDDPTHTSPPRLADVLQRLQMEGLEIAFQAQRYRPVLPMIAGAILEPVSFLSSRAMPFGTTWALYGFETVLWAVRR